jgi:hypothetical protein
VVVGGRPLVRTQQRELYVVPEPGQPARLIGRLPGSASSLVADGEAAWAVTTGSLRWGRVRLFRVDGRGAIVESLRPRSSAISGLASIRGVAGADRHYVYLLPDLRYDRRLRRLEPGHIDEHPDLRVLRTLRRAGETWYLARDRRAASDGLFRLWLLHSRQGHWLRVEAGATGERPRLEADETSLFLILAEGRMLRFDRRSLRLVEDLAPMLRGPEVGFFTADEQHYWVQNGGSLWRIERDILDGGVFVSDAVPAGFEPVAADGDRMWFGATETQDREPLLAVNKADTTVQSYRILTRGERRRRAFGSGARDVAEAAGATVLGVAAVVTAPIWVPIVLLADDD